MGRGGGGWFVLRWWCARRWMLVILVGKYAYVRIPMCIIKFTISALVCSISERTPSSPPLPCSGPVSQDSHHFNLQPLERESDPYMWGRGWEEDGYGGKVRKFKPRANHVCMYMYVGVCVCMSVLCDFLTECLSYLLKSGLNKVLYWLTLHRQHEPNYYYRSPNI